MSRIEINNITENNGFYNENKKINLDDFQQITIENIIIQHHKKNAQTTTYAFKDKETNKNILFLLTQDEELIKELKLPAYSRADSPERSLDLFKDNGLNKLSLQSLLSNMEADSRINFLLNFDSRAYSISLAQGKPALELEKSVNTYIDEVENMREFEEEEKKKSSLKIS